MQRFFLTSMAILFLASAGLSVRADPENVEEKDNYNAQVIFDTENAESIEGDRSLPESCAPYSNKAPFPKYTEELLQLAKTDLCAAVEKFYEYAKDGERWEYMVKYRSQSSDCRDRRTVRYSKIPLGRMIFYAWEEKTDLRGRKVKRAGDQMCEVRTKTYVMEHGAALPLDYDDCRARCRVMTQLREIFEAASGTESAYAGFERTLKLLEAAESFANPAAGQSTRVEAL